MKFGSAAATNVVVVNSTTITATTPAGSSGAVTVTVTVSGQSGSLTNGYTYVVTPTVGSVSPNNGPVAGGTSVTITGTNFASGATVTFGSGSATNVVVVNATTITATTPAGTAGAVTVTVTVNGQSGNLTNGYTYIGVPTVTSVSPTTGSTAGGTAVTITGTNFATGATVKFGSAAATNVVVVNSTTITATTPAGSAGAVTVTVTVSGAEREPDERVHVCGYADGEQRKSEQRAGSWRDGGDDHGYELRHGSDGEIRERVSDECGGGE